MFLNYFALGVLIFVFWSFLWDYHYSRYSLFDRQKRNHPHSDAIHVAGWVSLFTLHVIWPFYGFGPRCTSLSAAGACSIRRIRPLTNLKKRPIYNSFAND
ncbi:DUF3302 domain-containing protein [Klebsiella pneumoniae]|uniref:DUF3302 domain-containing protein n=1 Tax=Klebsiella pneumoniae TaxID=573 RepID=A0A923EN61_KLEPN|nr:DUF3302 domain-containing protein [Klebsiella pneumoniae]